MQRQSKQRDAIRADITSRYDHPTAEMVYASVRQEHPRISLATVYRNLENFASTGEIIKFSVPGRPDRYDVTTREHSHAHCRKCDQIFDLDVILPSFKHNQIDIHDYQLVATGTCHNCK